MHFRAVNCTSTALLYSFGLNLDSIPTSRIVQGSQIGSNSYTTTCHLPPRYLKQVIFPPKVTTASALAVLQVQNTVYHTDPSYCLSQKTWTIAITSVKKSDDPCFRQFDKTGVVTFFYGSNGNCPRFLPEAVRRKLQHMHNVH